MFEALSVIIFAGVMYFCLVVAPSCIELFSSDEFRQSYLKHFTNKHMTALEK